MANRKESQSLTRRSGLTFPAMRDPFGMSGLWLDPFSQFRRLSEQMDRMFDALVSDRPSSRLWREDARTWTPDVEVLTRGDQFIIRADLPGLKKDDLNVEITDDAVIIQGERQHREEEEREGFYRSERSYGRFYREIPLPEGADTENAQAQYRDGVLEISVKCPALQAGRGRRIEIAGPSEETVERAGPSDRAVAADRGPGGGK